MELSLGSASTTKSRRWSQSRRLIVMQILLCAPLLVLHASMVGLANLQNLMTGSPYLDGRDCESTELNDNPIEF